MTSLILLVDILSHFIPNVRLNALFSNANNLLSTVPRLVAASQNGSNHFLINFNLISREKFVIAPNIFIYIYIYIFFFSVELLFSCATAKRLFFLNKDFISELVVHRVELLFIQTFQM